MSRYSILLNKPEPEKDEFVLVPINKDGSIRIYSGNPFEGLEYPEVFDSDFRYDRFIFGSALEGTGKRVGREIVGGEDPVGITRQILIRHEVEGPEVKEILSSPGIFIDKNEKSQYDLGHVGNLLGIPIVVCDKIPPHVILVLPNRETVGGTLIKLGYKDESEGGWTCSTFGPREGVSEYRGYRGVSVSGVSGFSGVSGTAPHDDQMDALDLMAQSIDIIRRQTSNPIGNAHNFSIETADSAGLDRFGLLYGLRRTEREQESDESFRRRLILYVTGGI